MPTSRKREQAAEKRHDVAGAVVHTTRSVGFDALVLAAGGDETLACSRHSGGAAHGNDRTTWRGRPVRTT